MFDTIFKSVRFWNGNHWQEGDIAVESGLICDIGVCHGPTKEEVSLPEDSFVLPGAVDLHVHFNEPGRTHWEGFHTGSLAALAGGITTLAEMPLNSIPSTTTVEALKTKLNTIKGKSCTDYGLWGGLVPGNAMELERLASAGVMGFKAFMSPSGTDDFESSDRKTLAEGMKIIAHTGLRLALHAEDPAYIARVTKTLKSRQTALDWEKSRPIEAEISAVKTAIELSHSTGCPITIVHVSSSKVLQLIRKAKNAGIDIRCETCPHYFLLNMEDSEIIGALAKCAPPLRSIQESQSLFDAVLSGDVDTIGSDHSPAPPDLKTGMSFFDAWGGISGLQHGLLLLLSRLDFQNSKILKTVIDQTATTPAQLAGFAQKGSIAFGKCADFQVVQKLSEPKTVKKQELQYRHKQSPYVGKLNAIRQHSSWLRGRCVYGSCQTTKEPSGRFIRPDRNSH